MSKRYVVQVGDEVLRKKCQPVRVFGSELNSLLNDMKETVRAENGAGLPLRKSGLICAPWLSTWRRAFTS